MENARIEKKFVLGKLKEDFFKKFLLLNGFIKQFQNRSITSIYLDTNNYNLAKDNINGVSERKKIRFRWYNNNLNEIFFEEKNKKNFYVWKRIEKIKLLNEKIDEIYKLKKFFYANTFRFTKNNNYKFILKTNYERSYWISNNKKIRATIDINLNTNCFKNNLNSIYLPDTILEFKFPHKYEQYFRSFFNNRSYNLRSQKYSKYVRSLGALENSGYKI